MQIINGFCHFKQNEKNPKEQEAALFASFIAKKIKEIGTQEGIMTLAHSFYRGGISMMNMNHWLPEMKGTIQFSESGYKRWRFTKEQKDSEKKAGRKHPESVCREREWKKLLIAACEREGTPLHTVTISDQLESEYQRLMVIVRANMKSERASRRSVVKEREIVSDSFARTADQQTIFEMKCELMKLREETPKALANAAQRAERETRKNMNKQHRAGLDALNQRIEAANKHIESQRVEIETIKESREGAWQREAEANAELNRIRVENRKLSADLAKVRAEQEWKTALPTYTPAMVKLRGAFRGSRVERNPEHGLAQ